MDFDLTEDQTILRESVRQLLAREYTLERRQEFLKSEHGSNPSIWRLLAQEGAFGLGLPEDSGGCGGPTEIMLVMEEVGRALVLEPLLSTVVLCGGLIRDHGTVMQRAVLLPRITTGDLRASLAHREAGARCVLDHVSATARRGRGFYVLNGSKAEVLDAPVADLLIVSARDEAVGGLSLFMVAPDAAGVKSTVYRTVDGRSAADVVLDDVRVPTAARLGAPGVALTALEQAVDCALAALCAEAVGVIEAVNESIRHRPNTRQLDMLLLTIQAKSMSYLAAARCRDRDRAERRRVLSAAQACVSKAARFVGHHSMQIGAGTPAEHAVGRYFNRLTRISATLAQLSLRPNFAQA